ncbi:MAG: hypothetical protein IKD46_08535 [Lentisphaeria bacterium]|nr:hypothetical protein [Lentisphaeria bacterium]
MRNKVLLFFAAVLTACVLAGCTCSSTHVPGRTIDHGPYPDELDVIFCTLDYLLFPPASAAESSGNSR